MPTAGKSKTTASSNKKTLLNFFSKKKPGEKSTSVVKAKTTSTATSVATPRDKIRKHDPKTPDTETSTDVEDTSPKLVTNPTDKATPKLINGKKEATPNRNSKSPNPANKRTAPTQSKAAKKRRIIEEEDEEEWDDSEEEKKMEEEENLKKKTSTKQDDATGDSIPVQVEKEKKQQTAKKTTSTKNTAKSSLPSQGKDSKKAAVPKTVPKKKPMTKTNMTASGWGFLGNAFANPKKKRKNAASSTTDSTAGRCALKAPYTAGDDLPILSNPQDMFDDMVHNQLCENGARVDVLKPLLEALHGRTLKIATMCSGTESPVLALDMISKSIEDVCLKYNITVEGGARPKILSEHIFSCEIEPFKQSYIERNFQPKRLFRDIRELGNDKACTAFGALIDVPNTPGCVDLLVAGTSCVDYSNLNNKKKSMEDLGESGQTFQGMLNWIKKAQPAMIILENVYGAPWDAKVKLMECMGYAATFMRLDTKDYYIPQTRQRGYLFAVLKDDKDSVNQKRVNRWKKTMQKLERPASAALDAFMLDNDDPRVLRGRARLCKEASVGNSGDSRAARTDWSKCETRHQFTRANEELGEKRPMTGWSESGKTTMPAFAWNDWVSAQVNRVHDLLDINTLRLAQSGVDNTYKTMIWNLSQNVDRDTMGRFNLSQCLTPSGIPYVTNRGGPLVGEELLLLQGIPADDLLLTKESESDLSDLSGNAMTTCVVGACILSGLLQGHAKLPTQTASSNGATGGSIVSSLVPRPLLPVSEISITQQFGDYEEKALDLGQAELVKENFLSNLLRDGWLSSRKCVSEGPDEAISTVLECQDCGQTASAAAATPPRNYEKHNFAPISNIVRVHPPAFRAKLLSTLPTVLRIESLEVESLSKPEGVKEKMWVEWKQRVGECVASQFRFAQLDRRQYWSALYRSPSGAARLELRLYKSYAEWLLFAEAPCTRGPLRKFLEKPVARFHVMGSSGSVLAGRCEVRLPVVTKSNITVEAIGNPIESWRRRLGLKGEYETETQFNQLRVTVENGANENIKAMVDGVYDYLPMCGGACGSTHKKQQDTTSEDPVFFFLESGRVSLPKNDYYAFANSCHRTSYCEHRELLLMVDPLEEFRPVFPNSDPSAEEKIKVLKALVPGQWLAMDAATIRQDVKKASCSVPSSSLVVPMRVDGWKACPELVSFDVPMNESDDLFLKCVQANNPLDLNLQKSKRYFQDMAFVTARLTIPQKNEDWLMLDRSLVERENEEDIVCPKCAPPKPQVRWKLVQKGKKRVYTPIEDWQESAAYEVALKTRPAPWNVRINAHKGEGDVDSSVRVQIGFNAKLKFTSNKKDAEAEQPPNFRKFQLRKEQRRSLSWMLQQEQSSVPFMEEEVCENVLPSLEWRAEGRARRPVLVRGGIIADEVGYGKTCITLACIDAHNATDIQDDPTTGFVKTKATLVVVPGHLMGQWPQEVEKFLGKSKKLICIKDMKTFNEISVEAIMTADIVVVNFTVLCTDTYYARLARLSGKSPKSIPAGKNGGRHFDSVYESCLESLPKRISQLKENCSSAFKAVESDAAACQEQEKQEGTSFRLDGKKAVYKNGGESNKNEARGNLEAKEVDPWKLRDAKNDYTQMKCPPLELFHWRRCVVDEFTYLLDKPDRQRPLSLVQRGVRADFKWVLSGTPRHETFDDIECLAKLLNVHLGVEEALPGAKIGKGPRGNESTGAECMSQFLEVKSLQWHERRRILAQSFLDRFVRQNIAEIDEIPSKEDEILVDPTPLERAIYLELETYLENLDFNAQTAKMSRKKSQSDRENRMQKVLEGSSTAEEALLKCCAHFNISGESTTVLSTLEDIIGCRRTEKVDLEDTIVAAVAAAIRQQNRIEKEQNGWITLKKQDKGELLNALARFLDQVKASKSIPHGADDAIEERVKELVSKAEAKANDNPNETDLAFVDVNGQVDESDTEESDDIDGSSSAKKRKLTSGDKGKPSKSEDESAKKERLFKMKKALRDHVTYVQGLGKELCGRVRSLRYIEQIRRLQQDGANIQCKSCDQSVNVREAALLSCCGHVGCLKCVKTHAGNGSCVQAPSCTARVSGAHVVPATYLGSAKADTGDARDGSKLTAIIKKVEEIIASGDRMILFVQFDDLKQRIAQTLQSHGIQAVQVKGRVEEQVKALRPFQDESKKGGPSVLLLKMDDEQSAGLNLTQLNHVLFVHPLLADSQQQYDAYETQAIGRVRRFGQRKTVFVWRFLVKESIDTKIYEERGGRPLAATTSSS